MFEVDLELSREIFRFIDDRHNIAINYEKDSHNLKQFKKENDISIKFKCIRNVRQRLAYATTAQYTKKKSARFVVELNKRFFKRASNDINDK